MTSLEIGFSGLAVLLVLMGLRVPIAVALGGVSSIGILIITGSPRAMIGSLGSLPFDFTAHFTLSAIPMFLLMGAVIYHSGLTANLFTAARLWLSGLPGGLAIATNFASASFAAASGSSMATAAAMGRLALPEMLKYKYNPGLAAGVIAASGTLGSLIPPSILMVIYGIFTEQPISKLLVAGILPGLLTAFAYTILIMVRCTLNPELAPKIEETVTWKERFQSLKGVWAIPVLALSVIGSIYAGIATPTEAGAIGAFMAMVIAMLTGNGSFKVIAASVKEALFSLSSIFFIAIGAVMLTRFLVLAGIPDYLVELMGVWSVDPMLLVIGSLIIFIILGMFLDPLGLMLVTIPILLPLYEALDINLIWMGVLVIKYLEVGLLTPPVGLNAYVVKGVAGDSVSLVTIFKGISWFLLAEVFVIALLIIFPEISLYLPSLMD